MLSADEGIRKIYLVVEEIRAEGGRAVQEPVRSAAAGAVIANPLAGRFEENLSPLADTYCKPLGQLLAERALEALGNREPEAYGKGALVGLAGELEHGSAIIHNLNFGNRVREPVGGESLLPAAEKRGAAGATLDLPLKHKLDQTVRSHHQTLEVRIPDAPGDEEIVVWVAFATSGRPHARLPAFGTEVAEAGS
jgi:Amino acid synthesis